MGLFDAFRKKTWEDEDAYHGDTPPCPRCGTSFGPPPSFGPVAVRVVGFRLMGALPSVVDGCEVAER